jgi:hypothetical protein
MHLTLECQIVGTLCIGWRYWSGYLPLFISEQALVTRIGISLVANDPSSFPYWTPQSLARFLWIVATPWIFSETVLTVCLLVLLYPSGALQAAETFSGGFLGLLLQGISMLLSHWTTLWIQYFIYIQFHKIRWVWASLFYSNCASHNHQPSQITDANSHSENTPNENLGTAQAPSLTTMRIFSIPYYWDEPCTR